MVASKRFKVGDEVTFNIGFHPVSGVITEDRGLIGVNSRRLFEIRIMNDPYDDELIEMPEQEIQPAASNQVTMKSEEIKAYLVNGGLNQILNAGQTHNPPQVWLRRDNRGHVVHTFIGARGQIGGGAIPQFALYNDCIFKPKENEVRDFLVENFRLDERDAVSVIRQIGVFPK